MGVETRLGWPAGARALLLWVLLGACWFGSIQVRPLLDPDEGRYAEIPREMYASGDWVTPRFDGLKYFEKPPLQYWGTAAAYQLFGVSAWSSRLWTFALSFACLPLVFGFTRRLWGLPAALGALTALGVSPLFAVIGHLNLLDAAFTFWLSAAVFAFVLAQCAPPESSGERRWMLSAWALAALAVLSKGIVVGVLAGGALLLYSLIERDAGIWRRLHVLPGLTLCALIGAPWFIAVSARNPSFPEFFFVHEHFARFLSTVHQRVEPWWFFLPLLLGGVLPWVAPLVRAGLSAASGDAATAPGATGASFRPRRFLLIYALLTLAFFSSSGSKLAPYILPMLPPLAVLAGSGAASPAALARNAARIGTALAVLVAGGLLIYCARKNSFVPHAAIAWAIGAALAAVAGLMVCVRSRGTLAVVLASMLGAVVALQCLLCEYALVPPARSARELVASVRPLIDAGTPLYSVGQYRETISPYLGRTLQLAGYDGELRFGLDQEPQYRMTQEQFAERWSAGGAAVAFFDPGVWDVLRRRGLPGRVVAADYYTVAVSRL